MYSIPGLTIRKLEKQLLVRNLQISPGGSPKRRPPWHGWWGLNTFGPFLWHCAKLKLIAYNHRGGWAECRVSFLQCKGKKDGWTQMGVKSLLDQTNFSAQIDEWTELHTLSVWWRKTPFKISSIRGLLKGFSMVKVKASWEGGLIVHGFPLSVLNGSTNTLLPMLPAQAASLSTKGGPM